MKQVILKILGTIVIAIMALQSTVVLGATQSQLQNEQQNNNKKINEAKSDLQEVQVQKSETVKQVEELSSKINEYEIQIDQLDTQISDLNQKIENSEQELNKAQEDYTKQEELLEARLVTMQETGNTSYLDFLLSSASIIDFISNYYLASELANKDTELLEEIQEQKQEIEQKKQQLESDKRELDTSKATKEGVSTQLKVAKNEKNVQVQQLSEEEKKIQEEIDSLTVANIQIEKELKAAQEKYKKQIDALNQKNNSSSNKNNSSSGGSYTGGGSGFLQKPVKTGTITATMYYSNGSYHGALDYGVPVGTPVYAAAEGVVIKTANLTTSYGTYVVIQHANGIQTWYAHGTSGSILVSPGQNVSRGQQIMSSGNSGNSTGPHLHFEVRVSPYNYNTCRVDPRNYF